MRKCNYQSDAVKNSLDQCSFPVVRVTCDVNEEVLVACRRLFCFLKSILSGLLNLHFKKYSMFFYSSMDFLRNCSNMTFQKFMFYFKCELWFWAALMSGHLYLLRWNNQDPLYSNLNPRFLWSLSSCCWERSCGRKWNAPNCTDVLCHALPTRPSPLGEGSQWEGLHCVTKVARCAVLSWLKFS